MTKQPSDVHLKSFDEVLELPFPMVKLYQWMQVIDEPRLERAKLLTTRAADVAAAFAQTVASMQKFPANTEGFYTVPRPSYELNHELKKTEDVAFRLGPPGKTTPVAGASNWGLEEGTLDVTYVDRELSVTRATKLYPGDRASLPTLEIDLLLRAADGAIIVGETKVKRDRDLSYGLVQALAGVSLLASESQVTRLKSTYTDQGFTTPFDVYLVAVPHEGGATFLNDLNDQAKEMANALLADDICPPHIRRVVTTSASVAAHDPDSLDLSVKWLV